MPAAFAANDNKKRSLLARLFGAKAGPWERYVPMSPGAAVEVLTRGLPQDTKVDLEIYPSGLGHISVSGGGLQEARSFDLAERLIDNGTESTFRVTEDGQKGQGLGRRLMRNEIEFFRACGVKKFRICASLSNGGYTWARLGFLPVPEAAAPGGYLQRELAARYKKLEPLLEEAEKPALAEALKFNDVKDAWRLADARVDLAPRLRAVFAKAAGGDPAAVETRRQLRRMNSGLEKDLTAGAALPFGRVLMAGTSWDGCLDLENAEQMDRVAAYTGGWNPQLQAKPQRTKKFKVW